eukprot:7770479-Pyramimonas_sp.AAC.1
MPVSPCDTLEDRKTIGQDEYNDVLLVESADLRDRVTWQSDVCRHCRSCPRIAASEFVCTHVCNAA